MERAEAKNAADTKVTKDGIEFLCSKCKQPLYQMYYLGQKYPASQCLNHSCSEYGQPQSFKKGKEKDGKSES